MTEPTNRRTFIRQGALASGTVLASTGPSSAIAPGGGLDRQDLLRRLRGMHSFQTTPFRPDGALDEGGLRRNVASLVAADTFQHTIVVGGGMGEVFSLDIAEHAAMARSAVQGAGGAVPVVVGVPGGYRLAIERARNAQRAGADAILLFAPPYWGGDGAGVWRYFKSVAESIEIGILIAVVHGYPGGPQKEAFWPDVLKKLAEIPNVLGFEDSSGGIEVGQSLGALVPDRFLWIARGEGHGTRALPAGARACTSAVAAFVPDACRRFWELGVRGDREGMKTVLTERIRTMGRVRGLRPGYHVSGLKVAWEALGGAGGPVRVPLRQVLPEDRGQIVSITHRYAERGSKYQANRGNENQVSGVSRRG